MSELDRRNFRNVTKELDEVGVAVSVMGTSRRKLEELSRMVEPMVDALVGARPEVKEIRRDLRRALHNMRHSNVRARDAERAIREVLDKVEDLEKLVLRKKLGDVQPSFSVAGFDLINVWGYEEKEIRGFTRHLEEADKRLRRVGLGDVSTGLIMLDPRETEREYITYDPSEDEFIANPDYRGDLSDVLEAMGERVWVTQFTREDAEAWGRDISRFAEAFGQKLAGKSVDPDTTARLEVTAGRHTKKWPKVA